MSGKLRAGDMIKSVEYTAGRSRSKVLSSKHISADPGANRLIMINEILGKPQHYPIELRVKRTRCPNLSIEPSCYRLSSGTLDLSDNILIRENRWDELTIGLNQLQLIDLSLNGDNVGRNGCAALATILAQKESSLRGLHLKNNDIDDDCIFNFIDALQNNTTLSTLNLDGNNGITSIGWQSLLNLICNETSISTTYQSNHTLCQLYTKTPEQVAGRTWQGRTWQRLRGMLAVNGAGKRLAPLSKIHYIHFKDNFGVQPLLNMNVKIMPRFIYWIANSDPKDKQRLGKLHHLLCNWNVKELFGFRSAESIWLRSRIAELEASVEKLKAENAAFSHCSI